MRQRLNHLNRKHLSIRWKLVLPFVIITILVMVVLLPFASQLVTRRIEAEADRQLTQVAQSVGALMADSEKQALLSASVVATLPELETEDAVVIKAALDIRRAELDLQELSIYALDFEPGDPAAIYGGPPVIRRLQASQQTEAIRNTLIRQALASGETTSGIAIAPQASQIIGVAPIVSMSDGRITGVVLAAIYMDDDYISNIGQILGADVGVVQDNAVIVSAIDPASGYEQQLQTTLISPDGRATSDTILYSNNSQYRLLSHPLQLGDSTQGHVLVARPISELFQVQRDIQAALIAFAGVIIIISLALALAMFFAFARPLQRLSLAARQLSSGHLDQRVQVTHSIFRDEISDLGESFNEMVEELQALYEGLEYRVQKRTIELEEEQRKLNEALAALAVARDEAIAANQAKSEFVSTVSHELKVPMTSIRGYNQLLASGMVGALNDQQKDFLLRVENNVQRMMTLVSDLTDISRLETGQLRLEYTAVPIEEVVDEVVHATQANIEAKEQELTLGLPDSLPSVWADRNRLAQIMTNLVSNANKYTPDGGKIIINAKIMEARKSSGALAKDCVLVAIKDSGIGIHPDDFPKMFQKFFRSEDEKTRQAPGTGLGLTITKSLVELQGGSIWFESEFRKGTTFYFTMPTANGRAPAV
ncbi:MAG: cell wall metabolism sensor histidine kinase WalK [Anaerolineae bacterium]|nr:cell wall metabolism sensor histidine kinase WalK [Anaerolineae bacterium]